VGEEEPQMLLVKKNNPHSNEEHGKHSGYGRDFIKEKDTEHESEERFKPKDKHIGDSHIRRMHCQTLQTCAKEKEGE